MPTLEVCRELAVKQAYTKEWNNTTKWLIKKLDEEYKELVKAIDNNSPKNIVKELSDFLIVALQIKDNEAKNYSMDNAFEHKIADNYKNPKKTWDSKINKVIRK